jgi:hypothetical protein
MTMKRILTLIIFSISSFTICAQSCEEYMEFVKSKSYGTTYTSYNSDAISKVTFYDVVIDFQTYYFAIVCFKGNKYSYNCSEYICLVSAKSELLKG